MWCKTDFISTQKMSPQPWICFTLVLTGFTLSRIKASPGTFDYMVDCSACQSTPVTNIQSYTCAVRCDVEGKCLIFVHQLSFSRQENLTHNLTDLKLHRTK